MPRQYFCSKCGEELVLKRKSLKNKQVIIDLLDPHTCAEGDKYIDNITDLEKPLSPYQKELRNESLRHSAIRNEDDKVFSDQRSKSNLRETLTNVSSAPLNLLMNFKPSIPSLPERPMEGESDD